MRKTLRDEQLKKHRNIVLDTHDDELEIKPEVELTIDDIKEGELKFLFFKYLVRYLLIIFIANNCNLLKK